MKGPAPAEVLHVLVVDDSAVVRQGVAGILGQSGRFRVTVAADPLIALSKLARDRPDVILLDLEMPRMDGLSFLRRLMAEDPIPVVVCSGLATRGADAALLALEDGAVEVVAKPRLGIQDFLRESAVALEDALRAAVEARPRRGRRPGPAPARAAVAARPTLADTTDKVVPIGASTGGTEALRVLLEAMPEDAPGMAIVQHMPEAFTAAFARRLQETCRIEVKEAADGDRLTPGRALIAPGNRHLRVHRTGAHYLVEVSGGPLVSRHRPSVDVLFHSVAKAAGGNAVGVLLTGMGADGAEGLLAMHRAGAGTIAQDEASCVVFGMPKEAIVRGAVDEVLPLSRIAGAILRRARAGGRG